jgi:hypothetical protein
MPNDRNIFGDDKKLMHLCEDFLHLVEQMKEQEKKDPTKTPTQSAILEKLRYEDDPVPLDDEEYDLLVLFIGNPGVLGESEYADWKMMIIESSSLGLMNEDGSQKDSLHFGD